MTTEAHNEFLREQRELERRRREANTKECEDLRDYVDNRILRLNRARLRMVYQQEREEDERITRRAEERRQRREERIARYEAIERGFMEAEDFLAAQCRIDDWERAREATERENMYNEEMDQREVDRFWGLDLFEANKRAELERLRQFYVERVKKTNEKLMFAKVVNEFSVEADHVLCHDEKALLEELARVNLQKRKSRYVT